MRYIVLLLALALSACATQDYKAYADAQANVATARANADTARYNALSRIAEGGDATSKIAAVMALALGTQGASQPTQIAAPPQNEALQWASILVPSVTNIAGMAFNARVAMANADNNARVSESTNAAFLGIAAKIQAPVTVVPTTVIPQANVSTVTTTTNTDNHAVDSHAVATNTTTSNNTASTSTTSNSTSSTSNSTSTASTLSGSGVLGSGSFSTVANPVTTTANPLTTTTTTTTTNPPGKTCATTAAGVLTCI
jgi:hypothetical protein